MKVTVIGLNAYTQFTCEDMVNTNSFNDRPGE